VLTTRTGQNSQKAILRKEDNGTNINFIKVKGHTDIRGNEEADKRAKDSTKMEIIYFNEKDIQEFQNKAILKEGNRTIRGNYKKEMRKLYGKRLISDQKTKEKNLQ
jgi:predicted DCC family thiol-disulfide oxidoreductase YuxK